jgi:hypothetical protein
MLDKKILPLFNFALGSKLLMHEPIEVPFQAGETEKVIGNILNLNYTKTSSIKFYTKQDANKTFNNNLTPFSSDLLDFDLTLIDRNNQVVVKNLPVSTLMVNDNAQKFLILDLPFIEIDWTRSFLRRYNPAVAVNVYFGVYYIRNKDFENLIK